MRFTEASHPCTESLATLSTVDFLARLSTAEREIFGSKLWGKGLRDPVFLDRFTRFREQVHKVLEHPQGQLIIAGAGTSGRLAIHAKAVHCHPNWNIEALLAGGIDAFFRAKERVEDLPEQGAEDVTKVLNSEGPVAYLGITCGLSAAYVAGGLYKAISLGKRLKVGAVVGFNPLAEANHRFLPAIGQSMSNLFGTLESRPRSFLLNPVIGPEPLRGSTRMKGGTATKVLLDLLLNREDPEQWFSRCLATRDAVDANHEQLAEHIMASGKALNRGGGIVYLAGPREGLMALLDASECPPTFGARPHQVRAFVAEDFSEILPDFNMDGHRLRKYIPTDQEITFSLGSERGIPLPSIHNDGSPSDPCLNDLALKWMLNAITTGAFVQNGKVYGNRMIDLRISNIKLWERACTIVSEVGKVSQIKAAILLNRAAELADVTKPEEFIPVAVRQERLVATAILMAKAGIELETARHVLNRHPRLDEALGAV